MTFHKHRVHLFIRRELSHGFKHIFRYAILRYPIPSYRRILLVTRPLVLNRLTGPDGGAGGLVGGALALVDVDLFSVSFVVHI